jgi:transcription antitermination factor NusA-like protein
MKLPICEICAKEDDLLCAGCQKKLEDGLITASDVELSRKLYRILEKIPSMKDVEILRAFDSEKLCLLIVGKGSAAKLIGRKGQTARKISRSLGKEVRIVEVADDIEHIVESVLKPASILGINILYTKEGEIYRVRVPNSHKSLLHNLEEPSRALSMVTEKQFEIIFE